MLRILGSRCGFAALSATVAGGGRRAILTGQARALRHARKAHATVTSAQRMVTSVTPGCTLLALFPAPVLSNLEGPRAQGTLDLEPVGSTVSQNGNFDTQDDTAKHATAGGDSHHRDEYGSEASVCRRVRRAGGRPARLRISRLASPTYRNSGAAERPARRRKRFWPRRELPAAGERRETLPDRGFAV
jgi:hypothetical protein